MTIDDARAALTDAKPLHALAGAGDLLVAQIRTFATAQRAAVDSVRVDPFELTGRAVSTATTLGGAVVSLPGRAQTMTRATVDRAGSTYESLAERGETVVGRIRRQQATKEVAAQAATTVRSAKATRTTATKAAKSTVNRAKATATTARTSTKATTTRAKATQTSARKTTSAAAKATKSAAKKVGTKSA
jgi:hypothetical protein